MTPLNIKINEETRGMIILLFYTENATMKQTANEAYPTAQRLASNAIDFTWTTFNRKATSWVYEPQQVNTRAES